MSYRHDNDDMQQEPWQRQASNLQFGDNPNHNMAIDPQLLQLGTWNWNTAENAYVSAQQFVQDVDHIMPTESGSTATVDTLTFEPSPMTSGPPQDISWIQPIAAFPPANVPNFTFTSSAPRSFRHSDRNNPPPAKRSRLRRSAAYETPSHSSSRQSQNHPRVDSLMSSRNLDWQRGNPYAPLSQDASSPAPEETSSSPYMPDHHDARLRTLPFNGSVTMPASRDPVEELPSSMPHGHHASMPKVSSYSNGDERNAMSSSAPVEAANPYGWSRQGQAPSENIPEWAQGSYVPTNTISNSNNLAPPSPRPQRKCKRAKTDASTASRGTHYCGSCNKRCKSKSDLDHHERYHDDGGKNKPCTVCDKKFYFQKDLNRHLKTHSPAERDFLCNDKGCEFHVKGFQRPDHARRHALNVHNQFWAFQSREAS